MTDAERDEIDESVERLSSGEAADEMFLHGLLRAVHRTGDGQLNMQVQRVLAGAFDKPEIEAVQPIGRRRWAATVLSLAAAFAAVAIAGWALFVPSNEVQAAESLQRVVVDAGRPVDREYKVTLSIHGGAPRTCRLWVRGSDRVAAEMPAWLPSNRGRTIWLGFNGRDAWFVPALPSAPVMAARGAQWLERWTRESDVEHPVLQVESVLRRLRTGFHLRTFVDSQGRKVIRAKGAAPTEVEIVAVRGGDAVERLELSFGPAGHGLTAVFDLVGEHPVADDWYEHATHHDARRRVIGAEEAR